MEGKKVFESVRSISNFLSMKAKLTLKMKKDGNSRIS